MDFSETIADAKVKADTNGDGRLSVEDLDSLEQGHDVDSGVFDNLRDMADANDDGKIDFEDVKNGLEDFGDMMSDAGQHIGKTVDDMRDRMFGGDK